MIYNIWCYWSQGKENIPSFQRLCIQSWFHNLSPYDFKINIIDKNSFFKLQNEISIDFFQLLSYQQQSDVVRLILLLKYGGIWLDITTLLTHNLRWITDKFDEGFEQVGFYVEFPLTHKSHYLLENWCIAVKRSNNYIIKEWKNIFLKILQEANHGNSINIEESKIWQNTDKKSITKLWKGQRYLSMHVANLWCIQNNIKYKELYNDTIYLYCANNTALMTISIRDFFSTLIFGLGHRYENFYLIKFTALDRIVMNNYFISKKLQHLIRKNSEKKSYSI